MVTWKTNFQILFITGFRKLHGTQHSTVTMLEKRKESSRQKRISASYLWIYQRPLIQSITILCCQNCLHMVSLKIRYI